jgi:hypothetical protein
MLKVQDFLPDEYKQSAPSAAFLDTSSSNQTLPTALPEKPKKKKKAIIIPMLLGVLLLVGGAVSYALVQQNQDIRQSADVNEDNKCTPGKDGDTCQMNGGKNTGYLCKCIPFNTSTGGVWQCTTQDTSKCPTSSGGADASAGGSGCAAYGVTKNGRSLSSSVSGKTITAIRYTCPGEYGMGNGCQKNSDPQTGSSVSFLNNFCGTQQIDLLSGTNGVSVTNGTCFISVEDKCEQQTPPTNTPTPIDTPTPTPIKTPTPTPAPVVCQSISLLASDNTPITGNMDQGLREGDAVRLMCTSSNDKKTGLTFEYRILSSTGIWTYLSQQTRDSSISQLYTLAGPGTFVAQARTCVQEPYSCPAGHNCITVMPPKVCEDWEPVPTGNLPELISCSTDAECPRLSSCISTPNLKYKKSCSISGPASATVFPQNSSGTGSGGAISIPSPIKNQVYTQPGERAGAGEI